MDNKKRILFLCLGIGIPIFLAVMLAFVSNTQNSVVLELNLRDQNQDNIYGVNETVYFNTRINGLKNAPMGILNFGDSVLLATPKGRVWTDTTSQTEGQVYFQEPGKYLLLFHAGHDFFTTKEIDVIQTHKPTIRDTMVYIFAPDVEIVGNEVVFSAYAEGVKKWYWEFGESGTVDDYEGQVIYTYENPGTYKVKLRTDITKYPVYHTIVIEDEFKVKEDSAVVTVDTLQIACDDIKLHLQRIANASANNTNIFYTESKYIIKKYLQCQKNSTPVVINGKYNDFASYVQALHYLYGKRGKVLQIDEVKIDNLDCIEKLEITQSIVE